MIFKNKYGFMEQPSAPWLWTFLFGSWPADGGAYITHAIAMVLVYLTIGIFTGWSEVSLIVNGVPSLVWVCFAHVIIRDHYLAKGWEQIDPLPPDSEYPDLQTRMKKMERTTDKLAHIIELQNEIIKSHDKSIN